MINSMYFMFMLQRLISYDFQLIYVMKNTMGLCFLKTPCYKLIAQIMHVRVLGLVSNFLHDVYPNDPMICSIMIFMIITKVIMYDIMISKWGWQVFVILELGFKLWLWISMYWCYHDYNHAQNINMLLLARVGSKPKSLGYVPSPT